MNKHIFFILFCIFSSKIYSQTIKNSYITQDTIIIEKPVIVSIKGYDGKFLLNEEFLVENINIKRALENQKAFLYNDDGIGLISTKDRKKNKISIGECNYLNKVSKNGLTIWRLPPENNKFYLGFIRVDFYNGKIISSTNNKTYLKNSNKFMPIAYPICK